MRSRTLIMVALCASFAGCATPEAKAVCAPVAGWATAFRCGGGGGGGATAAAAPTAAPAPEPATGPVAVAPPPEPVKPEPPPPEPVKPEPPKVEMKGSRIELLEAVQFEPDSATLLDRSKQVLDEVAQALTDHPEVRKIQIEGYSDGTVAKSRNAKLSEQRVASVKSYLVSKGIDAKRLKTKGFTKNRRMELKVIDRKKGR
jgi:OOP family OmpA-OmpF porin